MADRYFIHPVGEVSNQSISQHPSLAQVMPDFNAECYFGKSRAIIPVFEMDHMTYKDLKASGSLSFIAFIKKSKESRRQYFYCQNLERKPVINPFVTHILKLISEIPKREIPKEEEMAGS
jgi:hypothetical protein